MASTLTRRDFIKLGAASLAAAVVGSGFRDFPPGGDPTLKRRPSYSMGRVIYSLRYYDRPRRRATEWVITFAIRSLISSKRPSATRSR